MSVSLITAIYSAYIFLSGTYNNIVASCILAVCAPYPLQSYPTDLYSNRKLSATVGNPAQQLASESCQCGHPACDIDPTEDTRSDERISPFSCYTVSTLCS